MEETSSVSRGGRKPVWGAVLFTCARRGGRVGMARVQSRGCLARVIPHFQASLPGKGGPQEDPLLHLLRKMNNNTNSNKYFVLVDCAPA